MRAQFAAASAASEALILGGRYQVTAVDMIPGDQPDAFSLRVRADDLNNPGQSRSMIITQAGLRFDDNVLRVTEIERANALMGPHLSTGGFDATRQDVDPMVVSNVGIGRNATLICYREAIARLGEIKEENELNGLLQEIILAGRRDRGPHFIHREAQLNELQAAVRKEYLRRQALRPDEP